MHWGWDDSKWPTYSTTGPGQIWVMSRVDRGAERRENIKRIMVRKRFKNKSLLCHSQ